MKTEYNPPNIEIVLLGASDIITTSGYGKDDEEDHGGFGGEWNDW